MQQEHDIDRTESKVNQQEDKLARITLHFPPILDASAKPLPANDRQRVTVHRHSSSFRLRRQPPTVEKWRSKRQSSISCTPTHHMISMVPSNFDIDIPQNALSDSGIERIPGEDSLRFTVPCWTTMHRTLNMFSTTWRLWHPGTVYTSQISGVIRVSVCSNSLRGDQ